jgi:GntR family transcriptional regulator
MSNNANSLLGKEGRNRPRYREIAGDLLDRITSGDLPVGDILKSEEELGQEFKASRGTIRQSLSLLQELGIILRRQREGTRVISRFPSKGKIDNKQMLEDWARYGTDFPLRI